MTELEALERNTPAWTTTVDGNAVQRAEWIELLVNDVLEVHDPLAGLLEYIKADSRRTFSKKALIELLEEFGGA